MELRAVLNLMYVEETATGNINVKIKEYATNRIGRIFYDGKLKSLIDYMETNDNLNQLDGFPIQVNSIHKWSVVEILVDRSRENEVGIPDYNKSKIIVIN